MWRSLLPELMMPLPVALVLLVFGLWRRRRWALGAGVVVMLVASQPTTAWFVTRVVEDWAVRRPAADMPMADAIVVLSYGMVVAPGDASAVEWHEPDRFLGGMALWTAGRASTLIFTGGPIRGATSRTEGDVLREMAVTMGVPATAVQVTPRVGTTRDEAEAVRQLLAREPARAPHVLLVTSASHMPRAAAAFVRAGLTVSRFPVDFRSSGRPALHPGLLVPTPGALALTQTALREWYGRVVYAATGG